MRPAAPPAVRSAIAGRPAAWVFGLEAQGNWADFRGSQRQPRSLRRSRQPLQDRRVRPVHRSGRLRLQQRPVLRQGRRCGDRRSLPQCLLCRHRRAAATTASDTRWGGMVGAGVEYGFAPNWSAGVEYDHLFMGTALHLHVDGAFARRRLRNDASVRTSISSPSASTIAGAARSSRSTDLRFQQTEYRKGRPRAGLFVWLPSLPG